MARSVRRTPIVGCLKYGPGAMRAFRRRTTKKLRTGAKRAIALASLNYDDADVVDPRTPEAVIERWSAPDDGRIYIDSPPAFLLRK
jgi:hypothetical protein